MRQPNLSIEFPERLWRRPVELYKGKPRLRVAASSYTTETSYPMTKGETPSVDTQVDSRSQTQDARASQSGDELGSEPHVKVSAEAGNAKVSVELAGVNKKDVSLNCADDSLTLSVRTPSGPWIKEISLPFRVDPDTAKAVFRNGKLELVVRRHGRFNPPRPRIDWV